MKELHLRFRQLMAAGLDISEHLGLLKGLACDPGVKTIVELGFREGVSATALCASGKPVTSYDVADCRKHAKRLKALAPNFTFIRANSLEVTIPDCELLFIDTLHTFAQLLAELRRHSGKVGKWIVIHDTKTFGEKGQDGKMPGLFGAIWAMMAWPVHLHLTNNNGLTILRRSLEPSTPL